MATPRPQPRSLPPRPPRWGAALGGMVAVLVAAGGCPHPSPLPGFPVAAPGGAEGPVHVQRPAAVGAGSVVVVEHVASDGRTPTAARLRLDAGGRILERTPLDPGAPLPDPAYRPLPQVVGAARLEAIRRRGRHEVVLRGGARDLPEVVLLSLPGDRSTRVLGVWPGPGPSPHLAVLGFESHQGAIRVEGVRVVDLRRASARRLLAAGEAARRAGRWDEAEDHLASAWDLDPRLPEVPYAMAGLLARGGRAEAALAWLARALELAPREVRARLARDPAFDGLRDRRDFRSLVGPGAALPGRPGPRPRS